MTGVRGRRRGAGHAAEQGGHAGQVLNAADRHAADEEDERDPARTHRHSDSDDDHVVEKHTERKDDHAERWERVEHRERGRRKRGHGPCHYQRAEHDVGRTAAEQEGSARPGPPLEPAEHLDEPRYEALALVALEP
jgi:hypothetical protein